MCVQWFPNNLAGCKTARRSQCTACLANMVCDIYALVQAAAPADGKASDQPAAIEIRCDEVPLHHR